MFKHFGGVCNIGSFDTSANRITFTYISVQIQTLESPIGNEYLNSSLLPLLPSQTELPSRLGAIPSNQVNADLTKHSVALGPAPAGRRTPVRRQSTFIAPAPKKRMSTIGVASSHG